MYKKSTNHIGHLILTIFFFPWALAWLLFYLSNEKHNAEVERMMFMMANKNG